MSEPFIEKKIEEFRERFLLDDGCELLRYNPRMKASITCEQEVESFLRTALESQKAEIEKKLPRKRLCVACQNKDKENCICEDGESFESGFNTCLFLVKQIIKSA
jgi:hypothetical protein